MTSKQVIDSGKFDHLNFSEMEKTSKKLRNTIKEGAEQLSTIERLAQDFFSSMYKLDPKILPEEEIDPYFTHHLPFIQKAMETNEYEQLRRYTKLDEVSSAIATVTITRKMLEENKEELERLNKQREEAEKLYRSIASLTKSIKNLGKPKSTQAEKTLQNMQKKLGQQQQQLQKAQTKLNNTANQVSSQMRKQIRQAQSSAKEEISNFNSFVAGYGLDVGQVQRLSIQEKMEIAEKVRESRTLQKISEIIGRMKKLSLSAFRNRVNREPDEILQIELGRDLTKVVPSDMAYMSDPKTEDYFWKKYADNALMIKELEEKEKKGRGAMVVCIDNSGSMSGDPEVWSKSIGMALLQVVLLEKRNFACIHFGSKTEIKIIIISPEDSDSVKMEKIVDMASFFYNGGTDFESPLTEAQTILEKDEFEKGDIVFISDSICSVSESFLERFLEIKKQKAFHVVSVLIGSYNTGIMKKFSDIVIPYERIVLDDNSGEDIFGAVI